MKDSFEKSLWAKKSLLQHLPKGCVKVLDFGAGEGVLRKPIQDLGCGYFACEKDGRLRTLLEEQGILCYETVKDFKDKGIKFDAIILSSVVSEIINYELSEHERVSIHDRSVKATKIFAELLTDFRDVLTDNGVIIIRDLYFGSKSQNVYLNTETGVNIHPVATWNSILFSSAWGLPVRYFGLEVFPFLFTSLKTGYQILSVDEYFQEDYRQFLPKTIDVETFEKKGFLNTHINFVIQKGDFS